MHFQESFYLIFLRKWKRMTLKEKMKNKEISRKLGVEWVFPCLASLGSRSDFLSKGVWSQEVDEDNSRATPSFLLFSLCSASPAASRQDWSPSYSLSRWCLLCGWSCEFIQDLFMQDHQNVLFPHRVYSISGLKDEWEDDEIEGFSFWSKEPTGTWFHHHPHDILWKRPTLFLPLLLPKQRTHLI